MSKQKIQYKGILKKIWYDPVLSKIISVGILAFIAFLYSIFQALYSNISFREALYLIFSYKIPLYVVLIIALLAILIYYILYRVRLKKRIGKFDIEQKVGNFTFRELYNALLTHKMDRHPNLNMPGIDTSMDLLTLFFSYQKMLNLGVEWEGDHFTYYHLCPTLMTYGLVEKVPTTNKTDVIGNEMCQTSKIGYEFFALLEKWRVYNDDSIEDEIIASNETNNQNSSGARDQN